MLIVLADVDVSSSPSPRLRVAFVVSLLPLQLLLVSHLVDRDHLIRRSHPGRLYDVLYFVLVHLKIQF